MLDCLCSIQLCIAEFFFQSKIIIERITNTVKACVENGFDSIRDTLDYDFGLKKEFCYAKLNAAQAIKHIAKFISGI